MTPLPLSVPYELGFDVKYSPAHIWSRGADVYLGLEPAGAWDNAAFAEYDALITMFFMLAETGALSGAAIEPWRSRFADRAVVSQSTSLLSFVLREAQVDDLSAVLCANAVSLGHARFPLRRLLIASDAGFTTARDLLRYELQRIDPYPQLYSKLPFRYDIGDDLSSPTLTLQLKADPELHEDDIRDQLLAWAAACSGGVYGTVLAPPVDCYLSVDPSELVFETDRVTFHFSKLHCHEAALRGLLNACAVLHHNGAMVVSATID